MVAHRVRFESLFEMAETTLFAAARHGRLSERARFDWPASICGRVEISFRSVVIYSFYILFLKVKMKKDYKLKLKEKMFPKWKQEEIALKEGDDAELKRSILSFLLTRLVSVAGEESEGILG